MIKFFQKIFGVNNSSAGNKSRLVSCLSKKVLDKEDIDFLINYIAKGGDLNVELCVKAGTYWDGGGASPVSIYETKRPLDIAQNKEVRALLQRNGARPQSYFNNIQEGEISKKYMERRKVQEAEQRAKEEYLTIAIQKSGL